MLRLGTVLEVLGAKKLLESTYTSLELVERALCKLMCSEYPSHHPHVRSRQSQRHLRAQSPAFYLQEQLRGPGAV